MNENWYIITTCSWLNLVCYTNHGNGNFVSLEFSRVSLLSLVPMLSNGVGEGKTAWWLRTALRVSQMFTWTFPIINAKLPREIICDVTHDTQLPGYTLPCNAHNKQYFPFCIFNYSTMYLTRKSPNFSHEVYNAVPWPIPWKASCRLSNPKI